MAISNLVTIPASGGRKWIVLALWLGFLGATAPLGARFEGAQSNEPSSFLPGGAESLEALELSEQFESGQQVPVVIVVRRGGRPDETDRSAISAKLAELRSELPAIAQPPSPPRYARDAKAALVVVPMQGTDELEMLAAVDVGCVTGPVCRSSRYESRAVVLPGSPLRLSA